MTKQQRDDFEEAVLAVEMCRQSAGNPPEAPPAWAIAQALRLINTRLDEIESVARVARYEAKAR